MKPGTAHAALEELVLLPAEGPARRREVRAARPAAVVRVHDEHGRVEQRGVAQAVDEPADERVEREHALRELARGSGAPRARTRASAAPARPALASSSPARAALAAASSEPASSCAPWNASHTKSGSHGRISLLSLSRRASFAPCVAIAAVAALAKIASLSSPAYASLVAGETVAPLHVTRSSTDTRDVPLVPPGTVTSGLVAWLV